MNFYESLVYYLVAGGAVALAYGLQDRRPGLARRSMALAAACTFWPLYLPLVLSARNDSSPSDAQPAQRVSDELTLAIVQVERELDSALTGLDGWAEGVLEQKNARLGELRAALAAQAQRIRDMEALVAREQTPAAESRWPAGPESVGTNSRFSRSQQAREENMARLEALCRQSRCDLLATLAWIRELVSMIHLARFTGAPAARAEELVAQIAAAVESISALSHGSELAANTPRLAIGSLHSENICPSPENIHDHLFANP